jgi:hypothetical protein
MDNETEKKYKSSWLQIETDDQNAICRSLQKRGCVPSPWRVVKVIAAGTLGNALTYYPWNTLFAGYPVRAVKRVAEININEMPRHFFKTTKFKGEPL